MKGLAWHGVDATKIAGLELAALEKQFAAIDAKAFARLLSACEFASLQIVVVEATERTGKGSFPTAIPARSPASTAAPMVRVEAIERRFDR